jgi:hypothetical protein
MNYELIVRLRRSSPFARRWAACLRRPHAVISTVSGEIPFKALTPKRDSASSPLERGLGVCYSLRQEHRFAFGVQYKTRPCAK